MLLITLNKRPGETCVEIDGVDITAKLTGLALTSKLGTAVTKITIELIDEVCILGEPGRLEFVKRDVR